MPPFRKQMLSAPATAQHGQCVDASSGSSRLCVRQGANAIWRGPMVTTILTAGLCFFLLIGWLFAFLLLTIVYDYTSVPWKRAEYDRLQIGMTELEVIALLGPPLRGERIIPGVESTLSWRLSHYEAVNITFDQAGTVKGHRPPLKVGPRCPTLASIEDWLERKTGLTPRWFN